MVRDITDPGQFSHLEGQSIVSELINWGLAAVTNKSFQASTVPECAVVW